MRIKVVFAMVVVALVAMGGPYSQHPQARQSLDTWTYMNCHATDIKCLTSAGASGWEAVASYEYPRDNPQILMKRRSR